MKNIFLIVCELLKYNNTCLIGYNDIGKSNCLSHIDDKAVYYNIE